MKTVLVLGAGSVSGPCIDYLVRKGGCKLVVADLSAKNLSHVSRLFPSVETHAVDVGKDLGNLMDRLKPEVVLNLMPPVFMFEVAKKCLERGIHQVHPAYLDEGTKGLDEACKKAGLTFITELGLDPGIDHMSAASKIRKIHDKGEAVESYVSNCGALPAAEANTNPWGYKLSWSPESLIGASKRTARVLLDGKECYWPDGETYEFTKLYEVPGLGAFEVYANNDSVPYKAFYGIPEAKTIYRGTIRYIGWGETICQMNRIDFFGDEKQNTKGLSFADFTARQAGGTGCPREALMKKLSIPVWSTVLLRMEWLGFFDDRPLPFDEGSPRDVVTALFEEKLVFEPDERDLIVLCDEIKTVDASGRKKTYTSTLIDYGVPGKWSAIARTTGVPPAIAAKLVLDGKIDVPGVHVPTIPEIYEPVLAELREENIRFQEQEFEG